LYDQWTYMEKTTQWRFTPPTHVVVALHAALEQFEKEGGQPARQARYARNCEVLVKGMAEMGFRPFLRAEIQAPIIVTFHAPADSRYAFKEFYDRVRDKGFILYPGKLTQLETFRVGCIGAIGPDEMRHAVNAVRDTLAEMGIKHVAPAHARGAAPGAVSTPRIPLNAGVAGSTAPCRNRKSSTTRLASAVTSSGPSVRLISRAASSITTRRCSMASPSWLAGVKSPGSQRSCTKIVSD